MPSTGAGRAGSRDVDLRALLVEGAVDYAIVTLDVDGHVLTWNTGAEHLAGYTPEEIVGRHVSALYPTEAVEAGLPDRELAIAVAEGRFQDEGWRVRKDGSLVWADFVISALRGPDGRLAGFGTVARDLTDRKAGEDLLRESEQRFRLLVTAVSEYAIFLLNPDGTVASWNVGAERLKGYRADEILGRHFSTFYTAEDRAAGTPARGLRQALAAGRWEHEGWRVRKDGSRFWADVVITALHGDDGTHRGFAKVTRDLTERKRNEDALRGILERERDATAQLRELDRMKTDFVAVVAHDLRAPVGLIQHVLQLLVTQWDDTPDDEKRQLVSRMSARAGALGDLVDNVFDVARIEAGQLVVETTTFDVAAVVTQVAADAAVSASDRKFSVPDESGVWVEGDERRTWQVLSNLVSNAVKFSDPTTGVDLTIERAGPEVVLSVADRGAGIAPEHQPLLFDRFARLPQSSGTPGTGMGLFIAKSLVEAQGGRLWVESTPGAGSTFRFTLPAAPSAPR